jgi:site-specific recombinase XerD
MPPEWGGMDWLKKRERFLEKVDERIMVKENLITLRRFLAYLKQNNLSMNSIFLYARSLILLDNFTKKRFEEVTRDDLELFLGHVAEKYSATQVDNIKVYIKKFYKWLLGNDEFYPPLVKWIRKSNKRPQLERSSLLTYDEFLSMIRACDDIRDRAMLWVLWEGGMRVGELLSLKIRDVQKLNEKMLAITVRGKTGPRTIPLCLAVPDLKKWIEKHPRRDDPDAPLFITNRGNPLTGDHVNVLLKKYAARAGIRKRVYPHLLRHSRATDLASEFPEPLLRKLFGWTQGSRVPSIYLHIASEDVIREYSRALGVEVEAKEKPKPRECVCGEINPPDAVFCRRCGAILDVEAANKLIRQEAEEITRLKEELEAMKQVMLTYARLIVEAAILRSPDEAKVFLRRNPQLLKQYIEESFGPSLDTYAKRAGKTRQQILDEQLARLLSDDESLEAFIRGVILRRSSP